MIEQSTIVIDTETRKRVLAEALTIQIERRRQEAGRLRHQARNLGPCGKADALNGVAEEQDRLRRRAEEIRREFL